MAFRKASGVALLMLWALAKVRRTESWSRLVVKYFGENGLEILRRSREP